MNEKFIERTDALIEGLKERLDTVTTTRQTQARRVKDLESAWSTEMNGIVDTKIPDLSPRTVARLRVEYPAFITPAIQEAIDATHQVRVPFWTMLFGNSKQYRNEVASTQLGLVRAQFRREITNLSKRPRGIDRFEREINSLREQIAALADEEDSLERQIAGLKRTRKVYSRRTADEPPRELAQAVRKSSRKLQEAPTESRSEDTFWRDLFIMNTILDAVREPRSTPRPSADHVHDHSWSNGRSAEPTYRDDPVPRDRTYHTPREDRGASVEIGGTDDNRGHDRGAGVEIAHGGSDTHDRGASVEIGSDDRNTAFAHADTSRGDLS